MKKKKNVKIKYNSSENVTNNNFSFNTILIYLLRFLQKTKMFLKEILKLPVYSVFYISIEENKNES